MSDQCPECGEIRDGCNAINCPRPYPDPPKTPVERGTQCGDQFVPYDDPKAPGEGE